MDSKKYQSLALMTESPVGMETVQRYVLAIGVYNQAMEKLFNCLAECDFDNLKRVIFYGPPGELLKEEDAAELRLVHGILGKLSETFELLEIFREQDVIDPVHLKEELGDSRWYDALIASSQKVDLNDVDESNIRKLALRNRNNGKFDLAGTLERNLEAEYETLANQQCSKNIL